MEFELLPPALGPLIGHVTANSATLWLQGHAKLEVMQFGVVVLFDEFGHQVENSVRYFVLPRSEEYCGVVRYEELPADARYEALCAVLVTQGSELSPEAIQAQLPAAGEIIEDMGRLPRQSVQASFRTFPESVGEGMAFLLGSCRYPGLLWPARKSDQIFAAMHAQCRNDPQLRFVLMNGDQIYADKLARWLPIFKAETPAEFSSRYQTAFSSSGMHALLRAMPTYMILDDHEIENDWNSGRLEANRNLFETAIAAYRRYQWLHSPRNFSEDGEVRPGSGDQLFYSFECAGYPFFVMDSRSQRVQDDERCSLAANHLLGDPAPESPFHSRQLEWLCNWLVVQQQRHGNRPKFVVSPSTFVPNDLVTAGNDDLAQHSKCEDDAWAAFPATRRQLLQAIVQKNIQNVVFLCGDSHSSSVAEIYFEHKTHGRLPLVMHSITSSAFYWPWPFANGKPETYVHDSAIQEDGFEVTADVTMQYRAFGFEQENNFTRVDVSPLGLGVQHCNREGKALGQRVKLKLAD